MKRQAMILFALLGATAVAAQDGADSCGLAQWHGREAEIEELLNNAEVVSIEDVGQSQL